MDILLSCMISLIRPSQAFFPLEFVDWIISKIYPIKWCTLSIINHDPSGFYLAQNLGGGGNMGEIEVTGCQAAQGVGAGGGCAPSCAKRGKLKHKLILMFP